MFFLSLMFITLFFFFFFNDTATTEIYTLSLHDALPIYVNAPLPAMTLSGERPERVGCGLDRKSTRLNSSHMSISYAVFCLKKKKKKKKIKKKKPKIKRTESTNKYDPIDRYNSK